MQQEIEDHNSEDIITIAKMVLSLVLEMEADPSDPGTCDTIPERITGCIQISGAWQGAVVVETSLGFAAEAASRMLSIPRGNIVEEDLQDALAELTNMIGGNIKSTVPGPSFLSLPTVTAGQQFDFQVSGAKLVNDVSLTCEGQRIRILKCVRLNEPGERRVSKTAFPFQNGSEPHAECATYIM